MTSVRPTTVGTRYMHLIVFWVTFVFWATNTWATGYFGHLTWIKTMTLYWSMYEKKATIIHTKMVNQSTSPARHRRRAKLSSPSWTIPLYPLCRSSPSETGLFILIHSGSGPLYRIGFVNLSAACEGSGWIWLYPFQNRYYNLFAAFEGSDWIWLYPFQIRCYTPCLSKIKVLFCLFFMLVWYAFSLYVIC